MDTVKKSETNIQAYSVGYPTLENYNNADYRIVDKKLIHVHNRTHVEIPLGVETIGKSAFRGTNIVSVVIPNRESISDLHPIFLNCTTKSGLIISKYGTDYLITSDFYLRQFVAFFLTK